MTARVRVLACDDEAVRVGATYPLLHEDRGVVEIRTASGELCLLERCGDRWEDAS